jgi:hypothetical protein
MLCNDYPHAFKFFLMFCKCFSCFGHMLQVFYLDGIKVNHMLHMLNETHLL